MNAITIEVTITCGNENWERALEEMTLRKQKYIRFPQKAYICSPCSAPTPEETLRNIRAARLYMLHAMMREHKTIARAPHAYFPLLLSDGTPAERALALQIGISLLEQSDVLYVCGDRISEGMKAEIRHAAKLKMPIVIFNPDIFCETALLAMACEHGRIRQGDPDSELRYAAAEILSKINVA